ncbi:hypothetical protein [Candidatus Nucleicultrix amoebiphila]|nr:hypothetical protein [Candidatus Nucleicultrix amoebiphila]
MDSIIYNKTTANQFMKTANSFRSLDLLSNLILALIGGNKNQKKETGIFDKFFDLKEKNPFLGGYIGNCLVNKIDESIKNYESDSSIFRAFRNHFTHGSFENINQERFDALMNHKALPPYALNLLPMIWLAILGADPKEVIEWFKGATISKRDIK